MNAQHMGAPASPSGSREPSPSVSAASGFDPSRKAAYDMFDASAQGQLVEDISQIVRCAPFIARLHNRHFGPGLASELANAVDLLACKVADLKEAEGDRR